MTITARFNGPGFLEDPDGDTTTNDAIAEGREFETTQKRFEALKAQGINVTKVEKPVADAKKDVKS